MSFCFVYICLMSCKLFLFYLLQLTGLCDLTQSGHSIFVYVLFWFDRLNI